MRKEQLLKRDNLRSERRHSTERNTSTEDEGGLGRADGGIVVLRGQAD